MANKPRYIIVHTVAKRGETDIEEIRRWHVEERGWDDIGYHCYIKKDGTVQNGRALDVNGAHALGYNSISIGVCIEGHGDFERWTAEQWWAFHEYYCEMQIIYGTGDIHPSKVLGHRETGSPKTCPGLLVDMGIIRSRLHDFTRSS